MIKDKIARYFNIVENIKNDTKEKDQLNKEIKEFITNSSEKTLEYGGYKAILGQQTRTSLNEDGLIEYIKEHKPVSIYDRAVKTKEYIDSTAVEDLIYEGALSAIELEPFVATKIIPTLTVKKVKVSE